MKKCSTRQSLFYNTYKTIRHWKDNKVHGQAGQSRTVTRRFAPSDPNLAQLPKKGEGVKFRECFVPHHKDAVMVSIDFYLNETTRHADIILPPVTNLESSHFFVPGLVAIACGANMNFDRLRFVAERAEVGEAHEAVFAVTIPEERGSFKRFCELVGARAVTEFNYRISDE